MNELFNPQEIELFKTGLIVDFQIVHAQVIACSNAEEAHSVVELMMLDEGEEDGYQTVEWGSFAFIYCLVTLSFDDAKPRNVSEIDYNDNDYFSISDLVACLSFSDSKLVFYCDYLRGRLVKTHISIESNGKVVVKTTFRGNALSIWLQKLQGKNILKSVS